MKSKFEEQLKQLLSDEISDAQSGSNLLDNTMLEPLPGHIERFEMRLLRKKEVQNVRQMHRWPWIALAAACISGAIVFIAVREVKEVNDTVSVNKLSDVSQDMAELEQFYNQRLSIDYSQMNTGDTRIQRFLADIKKLEEEYASLEKQLSKNYNNERLIKAMITNYQCRLRITEHMHKYIEIQNEIKQKQNEQPIS